MKQERILNKPFFLYFALILCLSSCRSYVDLSKDWMPLDNDYVVLQGKYKEEIEREILCEYDKEHAERPCYIGNILVQLTMDKNGKIMDVKFLNCNDTQISTALIRCINRVKTKQVRHLTTHNKVKIIIRIDFLSFSDYVKAVNKINEFQYNANDETK